MTSAGAPAHVGLALLADFGSTFTKLTAVDLERATVVSTASAPTTLAEGLMVGFGRALMSLDCPAARSGLAGGDAWSLKLACSSAAGGLKMVAIGLVPELTAQASRMAALGAGARIMKTYCYELTEDEVNEMEALGPDLVLLAGGTDGGNKVVLLANAEAIARSSMDAPVIVAGNKVVVPEAVRILRSGGKEARSAPNVLPELGRLNVDPVRAIIREIFIERIVAAKGLDSAISFMAGRLVMPTPAAVVDAARLLADGTSRSQGLGEVMVVDPGGATTDVHTVAAGQATNSSVVVRGMPEPRVKRTVEGDLGVRHSGPPLADAIGRGRLCEVTGIGEDMLASMVAALPSRAGYLPRTVEEVTLDQALASGAVDISVGRHVGTLEEAYTPHGASYIQRGKDLTALGYIVGTGGPIVHAAVPREILAQAVFRQHEPHLLRPKSPRFLVDTRYILSAMGLLAQVLPEVALEILRAELREV